MDLEMKRCLCGLCLGLLLLNPSGMAETILTMPLELTVIEHQAFADTICDVIICPEGLKEIQSEAFTDCGLKRVYLPESIQTIGEGVFSGCPDLTAYVVPNSIAEHWCMEQGITTVGLAQIPPVWVNEVNLNYTELSLKIGDEFALTPEVSPHDATAGVLWHSEAPTIASVSDDGIVTALATGEAIIKCEAADGSGTMAMCTVNVRPQVRYRALLIGEVGYASQLRGPDNDVNAMSAMLRGLDMGYTVYSQIDATKAEIIDMIEYVFSGQGPNDVSLFYYSGHGVTNSSTYYSGALMTVDVDYITTDELAGMLGSVEGRVIVILDSCGSGSAIKTRGTADDFDPVRFNNGVINAFRSVPQTKSRSGEMAQEKFTVLTASAYEEPSQTDSSGNIWGGAMTKALVAGNGFSFLSSAYYGVAPANSDNNNIITLSECKAYCQNHVSDSQHIQAWPEYIGADLWYLPYKVPD